MKIILVFSSQKELTNYCLSVANLHLPPKKKKKPHGMKEPQGAGLQLRLWRRAQSWTQAMLGKELGYTILWHGRGEGKKRPACSMISHIELGNHQPGWKVREQIEELTGIPASIWEDDGNDVAD